MPAPATEPPVTGTYFASATRSTAEEIARAHRTVGLSEMVGQSFDAVPDLILILDRNRQVVFANQAAMEALGKKPQEVLGQRLGELLDCERAQSAPSGCGTAEACRTCGAVAAMLQAVKGTEATEECRISRRGQGGPESLDLRVHCKPFLIGGESYVVFVARDISTDKRREVLERIFFHDILNLAGGINGITGLLVDNVVSLDSVIGELEVASNELVMEIHSQRLLLAAEHGQLPVVPQRLGSTELLHRVRQALGRHPVAQGRMIEFASDTESFEFTSDETILTRILGNLLKNALEASSVGGRVQLGCRRTGCGVSFTCHNDGCMPETTRLQIFQRSFSTKGSGRGLGSYSVKLLTQKYLLGEVGFTTTPEAGTTFVVRLPMELPGEPTTVEE